MKTALKIAASVDAMNALLMKVVSWFVLAAVLLSTSNAVARKLLNLSSNALLDLQWYLFSAVFLVGAGYALKADAHVRIDILAGRLSKRSRAIIDAFGHLFFLIPFCLMMLWESWPWFVRSFRLGEVSLNVGGLVIWPAKLLVPIGFFLLLLQAVSEIIKILRDLNERTHRLKNEETRGE